MRYVLSFCLLICQAFLIGCSGSNIAGTTSDTGTGCTISGTLVTGDGPAEAASVSLRKADYLSSIYHILPQKHSASNITGHNTSSDNNGVFQIDSVEAGAYIIECTGSDSLSAILRLSVAKDTPSIALPVKKKKKPAAITGVVSFLPDVNKSFVQVYGLDKSPIQVDSVTGQFQLSVPADSFK